ncbi:TRAP transporter large permease subunit [Neobacillus niacini]|uniref:TRAP transporter large permease subunit n=1 Tax=Neobacillus niacini TaxID=86668 RepID=UPI002FFFB3B1
MRSYLIIGMCVIFLIQYFLKLQWLEYTVVTLSLLAFLGSTLKADKFPRWLGIIMMTAGLLIEWNKDTGIEGISEGIFLILPLLSLITLSPLLSIPLRLGGYFNSISVLLRNLLLHPKKLYAGISGTLFLLTPILNLGSVRIINEFLEELKLPSALSAKGYIVGFATAVMWSPYFASVSLVLLYLNIPYKDYIIYGIGFSLLSLVIGNVLFAIWEKRHPLTKEAGVKVPLEKQHQKQLVKLVFFVILLIGSCLVIEHITNWSMIVIVCLVSIIIPLIFGIVSKRWYELIPRLVDFRDRTVSMLNNEIMLFMSAGMLAFAMKGTAAANGVSDFLTTLAHQSVLLFAIAVMVIVLCITYIGIHQIAAVGALAMQLNAVELGISNISLALLLLLTWSISTALSPFSGLNLMVSRIAGVSGVQTGLRYNGLHLFIIAVIGIGVISVIG